MIGLLSLTSLIQDSRISIGPEKTMIMIEGIQRARR